MTASGKWKRPAPAREASDEGGAEGQIKALKIPSKDLKRDVDEKMTVNALTYSVEFGIGPTAHGVAGTYVPATIDPLIYPPSGPTLDPNPCLLDNTA